MGMLTFSTWLRQGLPKLFTVNFYFSLFILCSMEASHKIPGGQGGEKGRIKLHLQEGGGICVSYFEFFFKEDLRLLLVLFLPVTCLGQYLRILVNILQSIIFSHFPPSSPILSIPKMFIICLKSSFIFIIKEFQKEVSGSNFLTACSLTSVNRLFSKVLTNSSATYFRKE